jgi:CBS domain-containing protein
MARHVTAFGKSTDRPLLAGQRPSRLNASRLIVEGRSTTLRRQHLKRRPVGENDRMVGTISDRDIAIRAVAEGKSPDTKVRVMSKGIHWAYDDDTVEHAAELMSKHQVRRLPVVNRDKRLVGIVALGDFAVDRSKMQPAAEALSKISEPPPS